MENENKSLTSQTESVCSSSVKTSWDLNATLILAFTETGSTPRLVSKYRPHIPIICVTPHPQTARQSLIYRGVIPFLFEQHKDSDNNTLIIYVLNWAKERELVYSGESVVIVAGVIMGVPGSTNMMRSETVQ